MNIGYTLSTTKYQNTYPIADSNKSVGHSSSSYRTSGQDTVTISDEAKAKSQSLTEDKPLEEYQILAWLDDLSPNVINGEIKLVDAQGNPLPGAKLSFRGAGKQNSSEEKEYKALLDDAFKKALADNDVESIYKDLILNPEKNMKVKQDVYQMLSENERAKELMGKLGISLT